MGNIGETVETVSDFIFLDTNASQLATGPKIARKSSPGHAQPANKQVIGRGAAFSPEGEAGAPALKMAMLDD